MSECIYSSSVEGEASSRAMCRVLRPLSNERGVALLLALAMLAIMTVIGVFALDTSTTEVQISGNYRTSQEAFFAADRAVMFGLGHARFPMNPVDPSKNILNMSGLSVNGTTANAIVAAGSGSSSLKSGTIECVYEGTEMAGGSGGESKVGYYLINATVSGPNGSEARVEAQSKTLFIKSAEFEL